MKYILIILSLAVLGQCSGQILDLELDCPLIFPDHYFAQNAISTITITQSGGNLKRNIRKHISANVTYYFDSVGIAYMRVLHDRGDYTDTMMMNYKRCESKSDPESRYYEENLFCNDRGMILANQTEKSKIFFRYDTIDRLREWIQIDREEDEESQVYLTRYTYDSIGHLDSIIDKEGALRFNLGTRLMDTIYRTAVHKKMIYKDDRIISVINYTTNNLEQIVPVSFYRYRYKGDKLDMVELYPIDDKKPLYTLKVLWMQ